MTAAINKHTGACIFPFFSELMHPRDTYPAPIVNQIDFTSIASGIEESVASLVASLDKHTEAINQHTEAINQYKEAMISYTLAVTTQAKTAKVNRKGKERQMEEDE